MTFQNTRLFDMRLPDYFRNSRAFTIEGELPEALLGLTKEFLSELHDLVMKFGKLVCNCGNCNSRIIDFEGVLITGVDRPKLELKVNFKESYERAMLDLPIRRGHVYWDPQVRPKFLKKLMRSFDNLMLHCGYVDSRNGERWNIYDIEGISLPGSLPIDLYFREPEIMMLIPKNVEPFKFLKSFDDFRRLALIKGEQSYIFRASDLPLMQRRQAARKRVTELFLKRNNLESIEKIKALSSEDQIRLTRSYEKHLRRAMRILDRTFRKERQTT